MEPGARPVERRGSRADDLAAAALALLLLLPGIGAPLWNRDEPEYAEVARTMARGGGVLAPSLSGRPFAEKPPLSLWLTAGSFRLFGESETAARLPHVLLAALAVVLVRRLSARLSGGSGREAAIVFAASLLWIVYARLLLTDSALVFFDLAAILGLARLEARPAPATLAGTGLALGLALLAKGPVALLAPALYSAGSASRSCPLRRALFRFAITAALGAAIAAPWWVRAGSAGGAAFFGRENLGRFLAPMEHHRGPIFYFAGVAVLGLFPWTGLLAGREAWRMDAAGRRAAAWAGGVALFFSASATKLPHYLLPALPALAILASRGLAGGVPGLRAAAWTAAATGALLFSAAVVAAGRVEFPDLFLPVVAALAAAALASLLLPLAAGTGPRAFAGAALIPAAVIAFALPPALGRGRCLALLGREAGRLRRSGEPVGGWRIEEPALAWYAGAGAPAKWKDADALARAIETGSSRSALVWIDGRDAPGLARSGFVLRILAAGANLIETGPRGEVVLCRICVRSDVRSDRR